MNVEKLSHYLENIGLNPKEIAVYLALLELGKANGTQVARKVEITRTSVIYLLEKLEQCNLIKIMQTKSGKEYIAEAPRKILTKLRNERDKAEESIQSFEDALPQLNQLFQKFIYEPKVKFYRGKKEIQTIYKDMLTLPIDEMLYVGSIKEIENVLGRRFMRSWVKQRIIKGTKTKAIRIKEDEKDIAHYGSSKEYNREVRFAPNNFKSPAHVEIYGDNVAIVTTADEEIGIVISSRDIAISMKSWFNELWKVSSKA